MTPQALSLVKWQAEDAGLWFIAEHSSEAYLQAALRALHEAVEADAALRASGWQPIATNPLDSAAFLAYGPSLVDLDFNPQGIVEACFDGERLIGAVWNGVHDIWNTVPIEPTHWMPLPAPPGVPTDGGSQ